MGPSEVRSATEAASPRQRPQSGRRGDRGVGARAVVDLSAEGRLTVRLALTRDQAGDVVQGLLSRAGGFARVECGGVVLEMSVREAR